MKKLVILAAAALAGCTNASVAQRVLQEQGYTQVRLTGYQALACSEDDMFHDGFEAMSPSGVSVRGVVCSAVFKGATVRTF